MLYNSLIISKSRKIGFSVQKPNAVFFIAYNKLNISII